MTSKPSSKEILRKIGLTNSQKAGLDLLSSTELGFIDGVTAGTATASKALVLDSSKGIGTITSLTATTLAGTPAFSGIPLFKATNAITAFSGGGQGSATALVSSLNRVTTVAADHDSVKLPTSVAGQEIYVANDGASILDVYPVTGDIIGSLAANVAVSIPAGKEAIYTCSVAGTWNEKRPSGVSSKYTTNTTATTFAAGQLTGASSTVYASTAATPGSIATRTATQMFGDDPTARVGGTYHLRITNAGTSTMTITAGSGVTLTGTMTIAGGSFRDFVVTYTTATALVIQEVNATNGVVTDAGTQTLSNKTLTDPIIPNIKRCTTQTDSTGTTLANITGITGFTVAVGTYRFRYFLTTTCGGTGGVKTAFKYTTTVVSAINYTAHAATASALAVTTGTTTTDQAAHIASNTANISVIVEGTMVVSTGGTVDLQFAENSANSTSSVLVGSYMELTRIA